MNIYVLYKVLSISDVYFSLWVSVTQILTSPFMLQYFGGTNFGRTAGGPLQITSYDYDAPIDEYGM